MLSLEYNVEQSIEKSKKERIRPTVYIFLASSEHSAKGKRGKGEKKKEGKKERKKRKKKKKVHLFLF